MPLHRPAALRKVWRRLGVEIRPRGKLRPHGQRKHHLDAIAAIVIVTVFLCLLVFVFIYIRPVRAVLLDVAPLAAAVADALFVRVRDGLQQSTRR